MDGIGSEFYLFVVSPALIPAISLAFLHDRLGLRAPVGSQRAADIALSRRKLPFFAADIALVLFVRLDQFAWHGEASVTLPLNISLRSKVSQAASKAH
jgi:hypothetical protein